MPKKALVNYSKQSIRNDTLVAVFVGSFLLRYIIFGEFVIILSN